MDSTLFVPLKDLIENSWPKDLLDLPSLEPLDKVWIEPVDVVYEPHQIIRTALLFEAELAVGLPGLDAVKLVFAPNGSNTAFAFQFDAEPTPKFSIVDIPIALRLAPTLLKPARRVQAAEPGKPDIFERDPSADHVDITLGNVTLSLDADGNVAASGAVNISLPPSFIGDTGVVVEAPRWACSSTALPRPRVSRWAGAAFISAWRPYTCRASWRESSAT